MSQQINLYNESLLRQGKAVSSLGLLQGAAVLLLFLGLFYGYMIYQIQEQEEQLEAGSKTLVTEQAKLAELTRQRSGLTIEQELKAAEAEAVAQREIINALKSGVIGNTRGYSEYMQAFSKQALAGLWLTGFSIDGDATQMSLSGGALNPELVPSYIQRLNRESIMRGKTFASLQMQLPKSEAGKPETAQYLEFVLQSVGTGSSEAGAK